MEPTLRNIAVMTFLWTLGLLIPIMAWAHFVNHLRFVWTW